MITPLPSDPKAILTAEQLKALFSGRGKGCIPVTAGIPQSVGQSLRPDAAPTPAKWSASTK